ncbi:MAG: S8 family serine peptidase [bacterium]
MYPCSTASFSPPSPLAAAAAAAAVVVQVGGGNPPTPTVSFDRVTYNVDEDDSATIVVNLSPAQSAPIPITLTSPDGVTVYPLAFTFAAGETSKTTTVTTPEDDDADDSTVQLGFASSPESITASATASIYIDDDEPPEVRFASSTYSVMEGGSVSVEVTLSSRPDAEIVIPLTATPSGSVTLSSDMLTFSTTETSQTFTVTATDNGAVNTARSVTLDFDVSPASATKMGTATVSITEAPVEVSFASTSYSVTEGVNVSVDVTLSRAPGAAISIPLTHTPSGGATSSDYRLSATALVFGAAETSKTVTLTAPDNDIDDDGRMVTLGFGALPAGVTAVTPATTTISIDDDDFPTVTVRFASASYSVDEGDSVDVVAILSTAPEVFTTVWLSGPPSGVRFSSSLFVFSATETSATVTVTALANNLDDDGRTVTLSFNDFFLSADERVSATSPATTIISIIDDDATPAPVVPGVSPFPRTDPAIATDFPTQPSASAYQSEKTRYESVGEYTVGYTDGSGNSGTDNHLAQIKASAAYARGATGDGQTIVIADSGIDTTHTEFQGGKIRVIGTDTCSVAEADRGECAGDGHGTAVASIAAGHRSGASSSSLDMHGVAFDADISFFPIELRGSAPDSPIRRLTSYTWTPDDRSIFDSSSDYRQYIAQGDILNFSFGFPWALSEWRALGSNCGSISETGSYACFRHYYRPNAMALAQADTDAADRSIVVIAASNDNGDHHDLDEFGDGRGPQIDATSPTASNAFPVAFNQPGDPNFDHILNVVAVGGDGVIASYSNRCGLAKGFCIAAPGGDAVDGDVIIHALDGGGYSGGVGTSYAAPIVSGSLAVLRDYFNGSLGNTELVNRLLATADDSGRYANSDIYGHGLVDLDAATRPVGTVSVAVADALDGPRVAAELSSLTSSPAFGDALQAQLSRLKIAAFDELNAPFVRNFASFMKPAATTRSLRSRAHDFGADPRGDAWRSPFALFGGETTLRAKFSAHGYGFDSDARKDFRIDSFSLRTEFGDALGFLSLRENANWNFGLHAAGVLRAGQLHDETAFTAPWLSFARDGVAAGLEKPFAHGRLRFAAFTGGADAEVYGDADARSDGVLFEYAKPAFSVQAGVVRETERMLGADAAGAFGALRGATAFVGASAHKSLNRNWRAFANANLGATATAVHNDAADFRLIEGVSTLASTSFGAGLSHRDWLHERDQLTLTATQPLRVEDGKVKLHWATDRNRYGDLIRTRDEISLEPTGRQLDFAVNYTAPFARGTITAATIATHNPGHAAAADSDVTVLLRYGLAF